MCVHVFCRVSLYIVLTNDNTEQKKIEKWVCVNDKMYFCLYKSHADLAVNLTINKVWLERLLLVAL